SSAADTAMTTIIVATHDLYPSRLARDAPDSTFTSYCFKVYSYTGIKPVSTKVIFREDSFASRTEKPKALLANSEREPGRMCRRFPPHPATKKWRLPSGFRCCMS